MPLISSFEDQRYASGTAFMLAWGVAITAWHNVAALLEGVGVHHELGNEFRTRHRSRPKFNICAYQYSDKGQFVEWKLVQAHRCAFSTDIAILRLQPASPLPEDFLLSIATIDPIPPHVGEKVKAFGYTLTEIHPKEEDGFSPFGMDPRESEGVVNEVFEKYRDRGMYKYPCAIVGANFEHGMSGGPVKNDSDFVCGVVSAGWSDQEGVAALLWPCLAEVVQWPDFNGGEPFVFMDIFMRPLEGQDTPLGRIRNGEFVKIGMGANNTVQEVMLLNLDGNTIRSRISLEESS
jgi:hypothetical protein